MASANYSEPENQARVHLRRLEGQVQAAFSETHAAREQALRVSREVVRNSANSIRATHRGDYAQARQLLEAVSHLLQTLDDTRARHPQVYYAGFVEDAQKEYAEACATLAFVEGSRLPLPPDLGIGAAPFVNGLAETVGELRRFILDSLRRNDFTRCEEQLDLMDEVYTQLVSYDFPEAVTRGLRRSTDAARGIIERTRGDLTLALRQRAVEERLAAFQEDLGVPGETTGPPGPR